MNESGELIGVIRGSVTPGVLRLSQMLRMQADLRGAPVVPLSAFAVRPDAAPAAMADLRERGELIPTVVGDQHVVSAGFAVGIDKGNTIAPADQRDEFSTREKPFIAFVTWSPVERLKGMLVMRLFDEDNRMVSESKPSRKDLRKRDLVLTSWQLPHLQPGLYRVDVSIDKRAMWRAYVRVTP